PADDRATIRSQQPPPPVYVEQNILHRNAVGENKTAKTMLMDFEKNVSKQAMATMKLQELMLHAVEQIGISKFESNSLEIFAQDGYTVDCNGFPRARTFVYSDNLQYRVSHHVTGFRTAFGCLWKRKTKLHLPGKAHDSVEETQCVTSYIFYPNTWIQWLGIHNGLEAIMAAAGRSWLFNCKLTVTRAVPEDSLIFELCRTGQTRAVEILLSKRLGSVVDTSPKGWKPLHVQFAAAGGHVDLCAMLIEAGADKSALVYEGPTEAILSPITLFVALAQDMHADVKISMLRLFSDCIELTDPKSDGWTVHEWLKRTYAQESVPISQNSITWLFHCAPTEHTVLDTTENLEAYVRLEFERYQQQLGYTRALFLDALSYRSTMSGSDITQLKGSTCTCCEDNYKSLPGALVSPVRIAVAECVKTNHRFGCVCENADNLHAVFKETDPPEYTGICCIDDNHETADSTTDELFYDAEPYLFPDGALLDQDSAPEMFAEVCENNFQSELELFSIFELESLYI
ncbi:hypothetical protein J3E72DRAFT_419073, partial [Bipolaris maydis]